MSKQNYFELCRFRGQVHLLFLLCVFPYFVSAVTPPPSIQLDSAFHIHHVEHSSIEELKNNRPEPTQPLQNNKIHSNIPLLNSQSPFVTSSNESSIHNLCYKDFKETAGEELLKHIESVHDENCLYHLFSKAPKLIRISAFRANNMIYLAEKTQELIVDYDGQGMEILRRLFIFLRAGYYNNYYHEGELDWNDTQLREVIDDSFKSAAESFINNPYFYNVNSAHGDVLSEVLIATDNADQQIHFFPAYIAYLQQVDERYAHSDHWSMRRSVNAVFFALYRVHGREEYHSVITDNTELIHTLRDFTFSDWALEPDFIWLAGNAALELARLLSYDGENDPMINVYNELTQAVRDILNRYGTNADGEGIGISVSALNNIFYFNKCQEFNVCGVDKELEKQVLNRNMTCSIDTTSTALIRTQNFTENQLDNICTLIKKQDHYFHEKMMTNKIPVHDDYNEQLEIVIFDESRSYQTYSSLFFDNDTDNGGIYLEGDPSDLSNTPRFIAYLATWLPDKPVWNLEHEYVHYLDGRFIKYGDFGDYKSWTHHTVWWAEGLAEYLSKKDKNGRVAKLLHTKTSPSLSSIFKTNYSHSSDQIYRYSYLAAWFMIENHPDEVTIFRNYFLQGFYNAYKSYIENIGEKYDAEFANWLNTLDLEELGLEEEEENLSYILSLRTHDQVGSLREDLTNYIDIPTSAEVTAVSSDSEIAEVIVIDNYILGITPLSPGFVTITLTVTTATGVLVHSVVVTVLQGFLFIPDATLTFDGITHKYMRPSPLYICNKTKTINLLDYTVDDLPDTISFSIGVNHRENIATAEINGHLLTVTAVQAGETSIWINMNNQGWRTDEILLEMDIVDDPAQCEDEDEDNDDGGDEDEGEDENEDENEDEDEDEDEDEQQCLWVPVGRIWVPVCN